MKVIERPKPIQFWQGTCRHCNSKVKAALHELMKVALCNKDGLVFFQHALQCPVCTKRGDLWYIPVKKQNWWQKIWF